MNSQNHLNSIQNILNNIADLANDLRYEHELPEYELTIDKIEFNNLESFEQNLKNYFITLSEKYTDYSENGYNKLHFSDWKFHMIDKNHNLLTIQEFFNFINLPKTSSKDLIDDLMQKIEQGFDKIEIVLSGYIAPPYQYNIYCQHWQHLYIKTQQHHLLLTFEANT